MEIREATPGDLDAIVRLHQEEFKGILSGDLPSFLLRAIYRHMLNNSNATLLVSADDQACTGFVAGTADGMYLPRMLELILILYLASRIIWYPAIITELFWVLKKRHMYRALRVRAELIAIAIKSTSRGKGFGAMLVESLEQFFKTRNIPEYHVFTDHRKPAARTFYEHLNFKRCLTMQSFCHEGTFLRKTILS